MVKKTTTISIDVDLLKEFKKFCIERGQTFSGRIEELMRYDMSGTKR